MNTQGIILIVLVLILTSLDYFGDDETVFVCGKPIGCIGFNYKTIHFSAIRTKSLEQYNMTLVIIKQSTGK